MKGQRMTKAIAEYGKLVEKTGRDAFLVADIQEIKGMSADKEGANLIYDLIINSLSAGFQVGYRYGKREEQNRRKAKKNDR